MENKKEKIVKMELKLRRKHPAKKMRLGRHVVERAFGKFDLNEAEMKELKSKGGMHWFISKEEADKIAAAAKKEAAKEKKDN